MRVGSHLFSARAFWSLFVAGAIISSGVGTVAVAESVATSAPLLGESRDEAIEPNTGGGVPSVRRLTQPQYRSSIAAIFGSDIKVGGLSQPDLRVGLIAVGASQVGITRSGLEQYDAIAHNIANQVVDEKHRGTLVPCAPAKSNRADANCARHTLSKYGRLLLRRPIEAPYLDSLVHIAGERAGVANDFYSGLAVALAGLLVDPDFIFIAERTEKDPAHPDRFRLTGLSKASRLSFLLWNSPPDDVLIDAAERGELHTREGLNHQFERMIASTRFEAGVRAFFSDMLALEDLDSLEKNVAIYPNFSRVIVEDAREQTLRTLVDLLVTQRGDYRDIFTTRSTFMTPALGTIYRVPIAVDEGWTRFRFPEEDPRQGLLVQLSFTALHAQPARSSPTLRGRALRELMLCQKVPDPPGNVDFQKFEERSSDRKLPTMRDRLKAHNGNPVCAGCHKITDPVGFALEKFDGLGQFRSEEQGAAIDTSGTLDGKAFNDAVGLGKALHDNPAATSCLVKNVYTYGVGRGVAPSEKEWLAWLHTQFASHGYQFTELLHEIVTSDGFYGVDMDPVTASLEKVKR